MAQDGDGKGKYRSLGGPSDNSEDPSTRRLDFFGSIKRGGQSIFQKQNQLLNKVYNEVTTDPSAFVAGKVRNLAWDEQQPWFARSAFLVILGRVARFVTIAFFWVTCFLAFAYYPYHLQMRRLATVVKSDIHPAVLRTNATTECVEATLNTIREPFEIFSVGDNVGFAPFDVRDESNYEMTKKLKDDGVRGKFDLWEDIQMFSRVLAVEQWTLLWFLVVYSLSFLNFTFTSSTLLLMGICCKSDLFKRLESVFEFWSQVGHMLAGITCLILVFTHELTTFAIQNAQLDVAKEYEIVCAPGMQHCFENDRMELCDFMRGSAAPGETGSICDVGADFIVPGCDIFGQSKVSAIDTIAFGQYTAGGYDCAENYCPLKETRDTKVRMASSKYWATGEEGPELSLGMREYSYDATQGIIVSMHVFAWLFIAFVFIDVGMFIYNVVVISQPVKNEKGQQTMSNEWESVLGGEVKSTRMLKVHMV